MNKFISIFLLLVIAAGGYYFYNKDKESKAAEAKAEMAAVEEKAKVEVEKTVEPMLEEKQEVSQEPAVAQDYTPAIWKIEHSGKTSYLFGSIHVGKKDMYPLPEKVMQAFAASDTLAVEANINKVDQMEMAQMIQQMALDLENPLPTVLTEKTKAKYDEYCETQAATCNMVRVFEPWMAAMTIEVMGVVQAGYSENYGVDKFFIKGAESKEIAELESIKEQLTLLDEMPKALQDYMVLGAVSKDVEDFELLMDAWKTGNMDEVLEKAEQEAKELGVPEDIMNQFNDIFLYKRNQVMADGIADLINQGKSVFAVVGAAHYAGKNSVNQYLEAKGFTVERL
ncbi:TraB/GumN family protein [Kangiella sp. TOML190]|uniref:TraB/GumN family protein n=1 Tax=Kangiella sp. TOML190 TaxID=2931351 RepID=UPI00203AB9CE|nr:TraB/GumN family protein [Kangiella sp. TOML190]